MAKPEKKCEGKCQLNLKLMQSDNHQNSQNIPFKLLTFEISDFTHQYLNSHFNFNDFFLKNISFNSVNESILLSGFEDMVFKPPID